ncbi:Ankyrin repeat and LEM domain-containing protein 2 like [Schistosoma japonicum]|nr:Ankyrin repeat and LEM domain-containing protein 2 like [Schistosoma japonicum]
MVGDNPMVLVTSSDTPTILQIRFRYNALHVIASNGNVKLLHFLLNCLDSDEFWERLYPNASREASYWRQQYVLDLYLNSPELGNLETPLHFASKYGHIECVSILARHHLTKLNPLNSSGQTPADLAASRLINQNKTPHTDCPSNIVDRIQQIFDESYIVLADVEISESNMMQTKILGPLNTREFQMMLGLYAPNSCKTFTNTTHVRLYPVQYNSQCSFFKSPLVNRNGSTLFEVNSQLHRIRGFSGPMPSDVAVQFRKKWLQFNMPNAVDYKSFSHLRLIDSEKGYERQGRYLSRVFGTNWYEYWEFLNDYIDLNSEDGLLVLEDYLSNCSLLNVDHPIKENNNNNNNSIITSAPHDVIQTDCTLSPTSLLFSHNNNDAYAPVTPIIRRKSIAENNSTTNKELFKLNSQRWLSYRQEGCIHELSDSLEDSCERTNSSIQSNEEMSDGGDPINKVVVVSPIVGLLKRLTFVSPLRWLKGSNQITENHQMSLTRDDLIPITDNNTTTNASATSESKPGSSNKRRISASNIQSLDSSLEKPGGKKHSPDKTKTKSTSELTNIQLPYYFIDIYRALPGNDDELKYFNPPDLPLQKTTLSFVLSLSDNSKFLKCVQLTKHIQSLLYNSSSTINE